MDHRLRCPETEAVVLKALVRRGPEFYPVLAGMKFDRTDLYVDRHQRLYDVCCYLLAGGGAAGTMDVFNELKARRDPSLGGNFASPGETVHFLIDVYLADPWFPDIKEWADPGLPETDPILWAGAAAVLKVRHLAARRRAAVRASELEREALNPTAGPDELSDAVDEWG